MTLMAERRKFQYRMRDLLWAVSLIGAGLGMGLAGVRLAASNSEFGGLPLPLFGFAAACFGAAIGCLVQRPFAGARSGVAIAFGFVAGGVLASFWIPSFGWGMSGFEYVGGVLGAILFYLRFGTNTMQNSQD
jgi:hypothetical protein